MPQTSQRTNIEGNTRPSPHKSLDYNFPDYSFARVTKQLKTNGKRNKEQCAPQSAVPFDGSAFKVQSQQCARVRSCAIAQCAPAILTTVSMHSSGLSLSRSLPPPLSLSLSLPLNSYRAEVSNTVP